MSKTFTAQNPATGQPFGSEIVEWDQSQVSNVIKAADAVKSKLAATDPTKRAALLNAIADSIEAQKDRLAETAHQETMMKLRSMVMEFMWLEKLLDPHLINHIAVRAAIK